MSAEPIHYIAPEEYLAIEREAELKSEYYGGQMFAMAGASFRHNRVVLNLAGALNEQLLGGPCQAATQDLRVRVEASDLYTYPDVVIVCGAPRFDDSHQDTLLNPTVLVEVLSPSTEAYDRGAKFREYRQIASLQAYVLVAQERELVEVFVKQPDGTWNLTELKGVGARLDLNVIGAAVPLDRIYAGVL